MNLLLDGSEVPLQMIHLMSLLVRICWNTNRTPPHVFILDATHRHPLTPPPLHLHTVILRFPVSAVVNNSRWLPTGPQRSSSPRHSCSSSERRRGGLQSTAPPLHPTQRGGPPSLSILPLSPQKCCGCTLTAAARRSTEHALEQAHSLPSPPADRMVQTLTRRKWTALVCLAALSLCLLGPSDARRAPKTPRCPATCSCTKDSAFCVDTKAIPKSFPPGIISL